MINQELSVPQQARVDVFDIIAEHEAMSLGLRQVEMALRLHVAEQERSAKNSQAGLQQMAGDWRAANEMLSNALVAALSAHEVVTRHLRQVLRALGDAEERQPV